jgi:saccharopine dehydrogenase-like NADP-dependent oxidoreductase
MKKIIVLGGYGNVGKVVVKDLIQSGYEVAIAWRDEKKIDAFIAFLNSPQAKKEVLDFKDIVLLEKIIVSYDLVVNCLEYTFNQTVLDSCIKTKKNYVDLWDDYNGIKTSRSKDGLLKEVGVAACLGAGSAPWIVNVFVKHIAQKKENVETLTISFADEIKNAPEKMLPFNFTTVVEEILDDSLLFENGKYMFVKGSSKTIDVDFCHGFASQQCFIANSYVTNHDEQFSLPEYLSNKGIKNVYFVMKHSDNLIKLVHSLNEFWFLDKTKRTINGIEMSNFDMINSVMRQYDPQNFTVEDKEILYIKMDETVVWIVNYSENGVPAGVMNTWIGCSLIAQYLVEHPGTPWAKHPEDFVDDVWMIEELKKRNFELYIDNQRI